MVRVQQEPGGVCTAGMVADNNVVAQAFNDVTTLADKPAEYLCRGRLFAR
jgi:hypothetical protein